MAGILISVQSSIYLDLKEYSDHLVIPQNFHVNIKHI